MDLLLLLHDVKTRRCFEFAGMHRAAPGMEGNRFQMGDDEAVDGNERHFYQCKGRGAAALSIGSIIIMLALEYRRVFRIGRVAG